MEIKTNKEKILKNVGIEFTNDFDYIKYMRVLINDLESHNENYTKKQYFYITQIKGILENMEVK